MYVQMTAPEHRLKQSQPGCILRAPMRQLPASRSWPPAQALTARYHAPIIREHNHSLDHSLVQQWW